MGRGDGPRRASRKLRSTSDEATALDARRGSASDARRGISSRYFGDVDEWEQEAKALAAASTKSWAKRDPRVFWRGRIRGGERRNANVSDCGEDAGNFARLSACSLTAGDPKLFDVRSTSCEPSALYARPAAEDVCSNLFARPPAFDRALAEGYRRIRGNFTQHVAFGRYQFLLDLPGSTGGSYSRNLNHLWAHGAVVALWRVRGAGEASTRVVNVPQAR